MHQECFQSYHSSLLKSHCNQTSYEGNVLNILLGSCHFLMVLGHKCKSCCANVNLEFNVISNILLEILLTVKMLQVYQILRSLFFYNVEL